MAPPRFKTSRAVIATMGVGPHEELLDITLPALTRYTERHDVDLFCTREHVVPDRPVLWSKVAIVRALLKRYSHVAWVDADTVVVDDALDLTRQVGIARPIGLVFHRYAGLTVPNMGVMALRRHPVTLAALELIWSKVEYVDHKWWENAALLELLGYSVDEPRSETRRRTWLQPFVKELDGAWNSIDLDPAPAPRIVHFAGESHDVRVRRMSGLVRGSAHTRRPPPAATNPGGTSAR